MEVNTYQQYLQLFQEKDRALLGQNAFWVQQAFLAFSHQQGDWDSLDTDTLPFLDYFTHICMKSHAAMKEIWANPQEKVVRVHKTMPSHQVHEMDSYCVNWLSRKSGRSKREKVALNPKIMGVKRLRSVDTGENRLFLAYMKKMQRLFSAHLKAISPQPQPPDLSSLRLFHRQLRRELHSDVWAEVGQWQNLPPNNSLLSHKDYAVIWNAWRNLRGLDQKMAHLFLHFDHALLTVLEGHLLFLLKDLCYCPQGTLSFSQEDGRFHRNFHCIDGEGQMVTLTPAGNSLTVTCGSFTNTITIEQAEVRFFHQTDSKPIPFDHRNQQQYLLALLHPLDLCPCPPLAPIQILPHQQAWMADLFPLFPVYFDQEGHSHSLSHPLLLQWDPTTKETLRCHHSRALQLDKHSFYSLFSTIPLDILPQQQAHGREMNRKLVQDVKKYLPSEKLILLTPDGVDDFMLRDMHGHLRSVYHQVETLPKSLGLCYHHQQQDCFSPDQGLVVVDLLGDRLSFTPLKPTKEEVFLHKLGNSNPYVKQFQGLVWERHPTTTHLIPSSSWETQLSPQCKQYSKSLLEVFTLEGLTQLPDGFPFFTRENEAFFLDSALLQGLTVDISTYISDFLRERGHFSCRGKVTFLTSSSFLRDDKERLTHYAPSSHHQGCYDFEKMQDNLMKRAQECMLWRDMLPQLEIHVGIMEIPLVKANQKIRPQQGVAVDIPISDQLKLEKGKETYRFKVKKEDSLQRYQAVVHRASFAVDLEEELHCKLEMTYEYGAQEPYCLYLLPQGKGRKTKVDWELQAEEDWQDLAYPPFPQPVALSTLLTGTLSHRMNKLKETWVPNLEPWEIVTAQSLEQEQYSHKTPEGLLYFQEREVERLLYQLEHPRFPGQKAEKQPHLTKLIYERRHSRGTSLTALDRRLSDQRFALYRLFFNGRTLDNLPPDFTFYIRENLKSLMSSLPCKKDKMGEFHFLALCLLHAHLDESFYHYCLEEIQMFQGNNPRFLPDSLGYALGDLSTDPQRALLEALQTLPFTKLIPILAKAIWNHEDCLFACPSDLMLELFDFAVKQLGKLYRKLDKNKHLSRDIALYLEYMLGVFRLRATQNPSICKHLSLNHPNMQTLKSLIITMGDDPSSRSIYSNIQLKRRSSSRSSSQENFFHLFLLYLLGDLGGADIQIIQSQ